MKDSRENKDSVGKSLQQIITPKDQVKQPFIPHGDIFCPSFCCMTAFTFTYF